MEMIGNRSTTTQAVATVALRTRGRSGSSVAHAPRRANDAIATASQARLSSSSITFRSETNQPRKRLRARNRWSGKPRAIEDDHSACETDGAAKVIRRARRCPLDDNHRGERADDVDAAVCRKGTTGERRIHARQSGREDDEAVRTGSEPPDAAAEAKPHQC